MAKLSFTQDELDLFQSRFENNKNWLQWVRVTNCDGLDVLSVDIEAKQATKTVRMTKKEGQGYLAKCVDEWGLTIARDFSSLLDSVDEGLQHH